MIKIGYTGPDLKLGSELAVGYDIPAAEAFVLPPGGTKLVSTGLKLEMPSNVWAGVYTRSGMAYKRGVVVKNAPGVIDPDYKGEVKVLLYNTSKADSVSFKEGDRIAQLIFHERLSIQLEETPISTSDRGEGGFGSTGQ